MLSLTTLSLSAGSPAISSRTGATWRHGPHHSAQKSTSPGPLACRTSDLQLWSVKALVLAPMVGDPFREAVVSVERETGAGDSAQALATSSDCSVATRAPTPSARAARYRSASRAAWQPVPAAVMACR